MAFRHCFYINYISNLFNVLALHPIGIAGTLFNRYTLPKCVFSACKLIGKGLLLVVISTVRDLFSFI